MPKGLFPNKKRGFAAMASWRVKEIAALGGKAAHEKGVAHQWTPEEAREAGQKGGSVPRRPRGVALAVLLLGLCASSASASDTGWLVGIGASNVADLWTTQAAISRGAVEANPLLQNPSGRVAIKAGVTWIELAAVHHLWKAHKGAAIGLSVGIIAGNGFLAVHNAGVR